MRRPIALHSQRFASLLCQRAGSAGSWSDTQLAFGRRPYHGLLNTNTNASSRDGVQPLEQNRIDGIDLRKFEESFGYTWLTHWKLLEEDSAFRQQVIEMRYSRRNQRDESLRDAIGGTKKRHGPSASEVGNVVINALQVKQVGLESTARDVEASEDLEWISSYPGDNMEIQSGIRYSTDGISVFLGGERNVSITPLWIAVKIDDNGIAQLYESVVPVDREVIEHLDTAMKPFLEIEGFVFDHFAETKGGVWRNFFIGLIGEVSAEENGNLWPNQILHKDRCLFNVRNATDIARFLCDPSETDVENHMSNLRNIAEERGYKLGWCWHMLRARWGKKTLRKFGITENSIYKKTI